MGKFPNKSDEEKQLHDYVLDRIHRVAEAEFLQLVKQLNSEGYNLSEYCKTTPGDIHFREPINDKDGLDNYRVLLGVDIVVTCKIKNGN